MAPRTSTLQNTFNTTIPIAPRPISSEIGSYASSDPNKERDMWVDEQLRLFRSKYSTPRDIVVTMCSWNVDQKPPPADISGWLRGAPDADVICVGLQEVDMSSQALMKEETDKHKPWNERIRNHLIVHGNYFQAAQRQMVGLYFTVFVKTDLRPHFAQQGPMITESTGAMGGSLGNKGGIAFSFRIFDITFCAVNAHLAAHMDAADKRNRNAAAVLSMNLQRASTQKAMGMEAVANDDFPWPTTPLGHQFVFFMGDLNYRIEMPNDIVRPYVKKKYWGPLLAHDQLEAQLRNPNCVWGQNRFRAATPEFNPTYRYNTGTDDYDTSEKKRIPAWTDRILWWCEEYKQELTMTVNADPITCMYYKDYSEYRISDHKPVAASLSCRVHVPDYQKKLQVETALRDRYRTLGTQASMPKFTVSRNKVDFGIVELGATHAETLTIENQGNGFVQFTVFGSASDEVTSKLTALRIKAREERERMNQAPSPTMAGANAGGRFDGQAPAITGAEEEEDESSSGSSADEDAGVPRSAGWLKVAPVKAAVAPTQSTTITIQVSVTPEVAAAIFSENAELAKYNMSRPGSPLSAVPRRSTPSAGPTPSAASAGGGKNVFDLLDKDGKGKAEEEDLFASVSPLDAAAGSRSAAAASNPPNIVGRGTDALPTTGDSHFVGAEVFTIPLKFTLMLQTKFGGNKCVEVVARFRPSCIGASLPWMVHTRDLPTAKFFACGGRAWQAKQQMPSLPAVPKELYVLLDYLATYRASHPGGFGAAKGGASDVSAAESGLFAPGNPLDVEKLRVRLDNERGTIPQEFVPPQAVADTLFSILRALPQPVVPYRLYYSAIEAVKSSTPPSVREEDVLRIVNKDLPTIHHNVFYYLISFMDFWISTSPDGQPARSADLSPELIARGFANVMLRAPPPESEWFLEEGTGLKPAEEALAATQFILAFLEAHANAKKRRRAVAMSQGAV